ncbi:MAG: tetratricopeptide repeat protein, partial [Anaerolineae bacterium]
RVVNYARRVESGLNEALKKLKVEGVYVERAYEVYTEENARSKAAARKAALVIYGWYDDAGVNPRFELVRAPQEYMPVLKQAPVDLVELDKLELRVGRELKEMNYIAAAAIGLAYYADGQMAQALSFFNLALESAPEEARLMGRESVYFYKGTTHFYLHQFPQAVEALQETIRLAPNLYEAHHNLTIAYSVNCDTDAGLRETDEALRLKPESSDTYYFRGVLLMAENRWEEAAEALRKATELAPENAATYAALGQVYETLGRADEAAAAYQKATTLSGQNLGEKKDDPQAMAAHADILAGQGKPEEAVEEYKQAIQRAEALGLRPDRLAWLYRSLGRTYLDLERWAEAAEAYERAVALDPGLPTDQSSLGMAYQHLERYDQAVAAYREALAILPCDANTHDLLGDLYWKLGRVDDALREYQEAARYDPDDFTAWHAIGQILEERGQMDEAKAAYEKAVTAAEAYLKGNPRDATVTYTLGLMYLLLGDTERAIALLQKAVALKPSADGHRSLGNAYSQAGEHEKALEEYQAALAMDPQNVASWTALGDTYATLGRTDEAIAAYRQALALKEDADIHAYIALLLDKQGRTDEAEAEYRASLRVKDNALAHVGLAEIYERSGRTEEAIAEYRAALPLVQDPAMVANIHLTLARLYGQLGRTEEAMDAYRAALVLLSEDPSLDSTRATVAFYLLDRCRPEEALSVLQPALEREEKPSLEVLMVGGLVYGALGRDAEAASVYATLLQEHPDAVAAHYLAAWFAYQQDRLDEAIGGMQKAVELDPEFFPAWKDLGYFLDVRGDLVGARSAYSRTLEILPSHVNAWMGLGEIALQEGKPEEALALFQEALQQYPEFSQRVQDGLQTGLISIHLDLALAYERLGHGPEAAKEWATAQKLAEEIAAKAPSNSQAFFQLAAAYWASGETQKAEAPLAQAVQCNAALAAQWKRLQKRFALLRASP